MTTRRMQVADTNPPLDLRAVVGSFGKAPETIDGSGFVARAIAFANKDVQSQIEWIVDGDLAGFVELFPKNDTGMRTAVTKGVEDTLALRVGIEHLLALAISADAKLSLNEYLRQHGYALNAVNLQPQFTETHGEFSLSYRLKLNSAEQLLAYLAFLLADEKRSFRSNLCQCQLNSCRRFFLVQKRSTGRPRRDYCSDEHMLEKHALESTVRAQKSRANRPRKHK